MCRRLPSVVQVLSCMTAVVVNGLPFSDGSILALKVSTGSSSALTSVATAFVLEERNSTSGALVQPTLTIGACTISGTSTMAGQLSMSPNGANSAFACYDAAVGSSNPGVLGSVARGAVILNADSTTTAFAGFGAAYQSPAREVYSAVVASASNNFYVGGDGGNVRGLSYSVGPGQITTAINKIQSRKATVFGGSLYVAGPLGPGPGVHLVGTAGSPPTSAANEVRVTTDTTKSSIYGSGASVASYFFQSSSLLWICDDGGASTQGVWLFPWNPTALLYEPTSSSSRVWSSTGCSDIAGRLGTDGMVFTVYFVGDSASGNSIYKFDAIAPFTVTAMFTSSAPSDAYRGVAMVPIPPSETQTQSCTRSMSPSPSSSATLTRSQRVTASQSASQTQSQSRSPARTSSQSVSRTASTSPTETQSRSQTRSSSQTTSSTGTLSQSDSASLSLTASSSATSTQSASLSQVRSRSQSRSQRMTLSPSRSPSRSQTMSQSQKRSVSQTASLTLLFLESGTATPSSQTTSTFEHNSTFDSNNTGFVGDSARVGGLAVAEVVGVCAGALALLLCFCCLCLLLFLAMRRSRRVKLLKRSSQEASSVMKESSAQEEPQLWAFSVLESGKHIDASDTCERESAADNQSDAFPLEPMASAGVPDFSSRHITAVPCQPTPASACNAMLNIESQATRRLAPSSTAARASSELDAKAQEAVKVALMSVRLKHSGFAGKPSHAAQSSPAPTGIDVLGTASDTATVVAADPVTGAPQEQEAVPPEAPGAQPILSARATAAILCYETPMTARASVSAASSLPPIASQPLSGGHVLLSATAGFLTSPRHFFKASENTGPPASCQAPSRRAEPSPNPTRSPAPIDLSDGSSSLQSPRKVAIAVSDAVMPRVAADNEASGAKLITESRVWRPAGVNPPADSGLPGWTARKRKLIEALRFGSKVAVVNARAKAAGGGAVSIFRGAPDGPSIAAATLVLPLAVSHRRVDDDCMEALGNATILPGSSVFPPSAPSSSSPDTTTRAFGAPVVVSSIHRFPDSANVRHRHGMGSGFVPVGALVAAGSASLLRQTSSKQFLSM